MLGLRSRAYLAKLRTYAGVCCNLHLKLIEILASLKVGRKTLKGVGNANKFLERNTPFFGP